MSKFIEIITIDSTPMLINVSNIVQISPSTPKSRMRGSLVTIEGGTSVSQFNTLEEYEDLQYRLKSLDW